MRSVIIGLCGRAGSGKSSAARFIQEKYGAQIIAFASALKYMAMDVWEFSEEQVFGEAEVKMVEDPRWGLSPRTALQSLGQAIRDHLGEDVFVKRTLQQVEAGIYVIEDVRYRNEASALFEREDACLIRLHCSDSGISSIKHPSEVEVDLIPKEHVRVDIGSSRELGLEHLLPLVDNEVRSFLRSQNIVRVTDPDSSFLGRYGFVVGPELVDKGGTQVEVDGEQLRVRGVDELADVASISCGSSSQTCGCSCPGGPCGHDWSGSGVEFDGGMAWTATCSRCGMKAIDHDIWVAP